MKSVSPILISLGLLLIPLALWAERALPETWQDRLFAPAASAPLVVQCPDDETVVLGSAETGYSIIELPADSDTCRRRHAIFQSLQKIFV